ncbi:MAG: roadblock/LC7 domain-containing protein [Planctomycetota bacterium]|nr:roadblock/LC7 domain-containing protein [Planctomycetota bacterium]
MTAQQPIPDDETLRRRRLVFYEEDVAAIDACLEDFLARSKASCALLVDIEGHLVTKKGFTQNLDTTSIAALVAGSFASTRALAQNLGEKEFSVIFHQGINESIHIGLAGDRCLVVIIFDDRTTIGMVRLYAKEVQEALGKIMRQIEEKAKHRRDPVSDSGFQRAAQAKIDEFFTES